VNQPPKNNIYTTTPLIRVGPTDYEFPLAAKEIAILDMRGRILWKKTNYQNRGPIRWNGIDTEGNPLETGDYVCKIVYVDGKASYVPFVFASK
jgi:hypothetical protein